MARMTISIPDDVKKRMDRTKEPVNWSSVAAEAFELKLGEIARKQKEKTMDNVVARLRASKIQNSSDLEQAGHGAGRDWAKDSAEYDQLERLSKLNVGEFFNHGMWNAPYGVADYLAFEITGTGADDLDEGISELFWRNALGCDRDDERLNSEEFLAGFAEGAIELYEAVAKDI